MRGHSRSKNGVASLAYDPRIHDEVQRGKPYGLACGRGFMDCRVKPGNDRSRGRNATYGTSLPRRALGRPGGTMTRTNILYLAIGALVIATGVLGYQLYQERKQPSGVQINLGPGGVSIEKK
jgi:hypothetical protein